jgi:hypothetical protein
MTRNKSKRGFSQFLQGNAEYYFYYLTTSLF